jgi:hypothetical protein
MPSSVTKDRRCGRQHDRRHRDCWRQTISNPSFTAATRTCFFAAPCQMANERQRASTVARWHDICIAEVKRPDADAVQPLFFHQEHFMTALNITDIPSSIDLDPESMADIHGGRMKLIGPVNGSLLTTADGDPVDVVVDGVLQNSVTDGYYHGH